MEAFICDGIRTPFGKYKGGLSSIRPDNLGALVLKKINERNPSLNLENIDDIYFGCVNQAGEDNRNIARMSLLLADYPTNIPACTVNRLCGSSLEAISIASRAIKSNESHLIIAGGVESMSRAPLVISKSDTSFSRTQILQDTTIGWRFINPLMKKKYGVDSMPETAQNVAEKFNISRHDQDLFALSSQEKYRKAKKNNFFKSEIMSIHISSKKNSFLFENDEHPRNTNFNSLSSLDSIVKKEGSITAGNSSGINDGAAALIIASSKSVKSESLKPRAKIIATATSGVEPRIMGIGPISATKKVLKIANLNINDLDVIEINEAFAAQVLAVIRGLGIDESSKKINPNGGAIALGHPLGASGARLTLTAINQLEKTNGRYALCTMCIGVGQGIAIIIERVNST